MPVTINSNSILGILEANATAPTNAVPLSMLTDLSNEIQDLSGIVFDLSATVFDLSNVVTNNTNTIIDICNQLIIIDNSITDLSGGLQDLSGVVFDLSNVVTNNITNIFDLSSDLQDLSGVVFDLSNVVTNNITNIFDLSSDLQDLSGIVFDLSNVVTNNITNIFDISSHIVVIDNSINILFDNSGADSFDQSYNDLYLAKPQFVQNISGGYDATDDRIEIQWDLPSQIRAANNFNAGTHQTINTNVFSPSLVSTNHAPYYPSGYGGNTLPTQSSAPSLPHTLDLTVPAYSTNLYPQPSLEPEFTDLNYLPYHQNIGIDVRRNLNGTISNWCPLQPNDIDYVRSTNKQHLWAGTRGFYIRNDSNNAGTSGGDYSPNGNATTVPGPGGNQGDKIYQLTNSPIFQVQGQSGAMFQFRVYLTNNSDEVLTATPHDISFNSENPPYWRYTYFPDVSNQFLSFASVGGATPPRNITNGPGLWATANQPPNGTNTVPVPETTYRTLEIRGQNNNARPYQDPSGTPSNSVLDANCAADASMSLPFSQIGSFQVNVQFGFDLSGEYHYPLQTTVPSNGASNPQRPWGEQYEESSGNILTKQSYGHRQETIMNGCLKILTHQQPITLVILITRLYIQDIHIMFRTIR